MSSANKRRLPIRGVSQADDTLLQMIVALTSQLSAARERMDTLETLLKRQGVLQPDAIEAFVADEQDAQRRGVLRAALIDKVMEPIANSMLADLERLENADD